MPRGFTIGEQQSIRAALLEEGRQLFSTQGFKKTSIDELARGAGISKGAFYGFFKSKEALLVEIIDQFETAYFGRILAEIAAHPAPGEAEMRQVINRLLVDWKNEPIFTLLSSDDLSVLMRRIPPEQLSAAMEKDLDFARALLRLLTQTGLQPGYSPEMFTALLRALFFIQLHERDFPPSAYQPMLELLIDWVAVYLTRSPENQEMNDDPDNSGAAQGQFD